MTNRDLLVFLSNQGYFDIKVNFETNNIEIMNGISK